MPISAINDRVAAVAQLWKAHHDVPFPIRLLYDDVAGVEMVMLDADVSGCVDTWLNNGGDIDGWRRNVLATRESDLELVLPALSGEEATFYQGLLDMAVLILESPGDLSSGQIG